MGEFFSPQYLTPSVMAILAVGWLILKGLGMILDRRNGSNSSARGVNVEVAGGGAGSDILLLLGRTVAIQEEVRKLLDRMDARLSAVEDIQRRCIGNRAGDSE